MQTTLGQLTRDHQAQARLIQDGPLEWAIVRGTAQFTDGPQTGGYHSGQMTPGRRSRGAAEESSARTSPL